MFIKLTNRHINVSVLIVAMLLIALTSFSVPQKPIQIDQGGTGATASGTALTALGGAKLAGDPAQNFAVATPTLNTHAVNLGANTLNALLPVGGNKLVKTQELVAPGAYVDFVLTNNDDIGGIISIRSGWESSLAYNTVRTYSVVGRAGDVKLLLIDTTNGGSGAYAFTVAVQGQGIRITNTEAGNAYIRAVYIGF